MTCQDFAQHESGFEIITVYLDSSLLIDMRTPGKGLMQDTHVFRLRGTTWWGSGKGPSVFPILTPMLFET